MALEIVPSHGPDFTATFEAWLTRGKSLALQHSGHQWLLGDWLLEGDAEYNMQNLGIPSHLLIGSHPPNFWKSVSDEVNLSVGTLKQYAVVARAYPSDGRFAQLSWSHHNLAAAYDRRLEYLAACIVAGARPHTLQWLEAYIEQNEESLDEPVERRSVPLEFSLVMMRQLKDLAKHYKTSVQALVSKECLPMLERFLQEQAQKVALEKFEFWDHKTWPFGELAELALKPKAKRRRAA
jgi:hypothetical protein